MQRPLRHHCHRNFVRRLPQCCKTVTCPVRQTRVLWACSERAFVPSGYRATVLLAGKKDNLIKLRSTPCIGHQLHGPPERCDFLHPTDQNVPKTNSKTLQEIWLIARPEYLLSLRRSGERKKDKLGGWIMSLSLLPCYWLKLLQKFWLSSNFGSKFSNWWTNRPCKSGKTRAFAIDTPTHVYTHPSTKRIVCQLKKCSEKSAV